MPRQPADRSASEGPAGPPRHAVRLADPAPRLPVAFDLTPTPAESAAIARALGIEAARKLRFAGRLLPAGRRDWRLEAHLGATVVQPCVVTLAPVTTRIEEEVARRYVVDLPDPAPGEVEMPDDETEPLPPVLDLWEVAAEALALALPPWPRAEGAELGGIATGDDGGTRPFAGLAELRDRLGNKDGESG